MGRVELAYGCIFAFVIIVMILVNYFIKKNSIKVGIVEAYSDEFYDNFFEANELLKQHIYEKDSKWAFDLSKTYFDLSSYDTIDVEQLSYYKELENVYWRIGQMLAGKKVLNKHEIIAIVKTLNL